MYQGCYTALITPFDVNGSIDIPGLDQLVDFQISQGISGILAVGTTGESPTLSWEEHQRVIQTIHTRAESRTRVIAGTGSNNTRESIAATKFAAGIGVDSVLLIDPYYNGPSSLEIRREYLEPIAHDFPSLSIMPYVIPGRTGTQLLPQDLALANSSFGNIDSVKEATGNIDNARTIRELCGPRFSILAGDDHMVLELMLDRRVSAQGVVSVASNIAPAAIRELVEAALSKNDDKAHKIGSQLSPLFEIVTVLTSEDSKHGPVQVKARNPLATKTLMRIMGFPAGSARQPIGKLTRRSMDIVIRNARQVYEETKILKPIEDFFDVDLSDRLYSEKHLSGLFYESY